jgi:hypothetical protein
VVVADHDDVRASAPQLAQLGLELGARLHDAAAADQQHQPRPESFDRPQGLELAVGAPQRITVAAHGPLSEYDTRLLTAAALNGVFQERVDQVVNVVNARTRRRGGGGWVSDDINEGRLDYFYYAMAVFGAVNLVYFLVCSNFHRYKDY